MLVECRLKRTDRVEEQVTHRDVRRRRARRSTGKTFVDTGVNLITDQPQAGVPSQDTTFGQQNCWG